MSDPPPPTYSAASSDRPAPAETTSEQPQPPDYTPPTRFAIGSTTTTEPLVGIPEIKGHLALLHSFADLKRRVDETVVYVPNVPQDKEKKWIWFVGLAVERFDRWCLSLKTQDSWLSSSVALPPIDVIMVWHSYMLNPRWYAEDCMRLPACKILKSFERHFKHLLLHHATLEHDPPNKHRIDLWRRNTDLGFDPLKEMGNSGSKVIFCPKCNESIIVDLMKADGTGYFQQKFTTRCFNESCSLREITKETLVLRKLVMDLTMKTSPDFVDPASHLAGSLYTTSPSDAAKGMKIKKMVCDSVPKDNLATYDAFKSPAYYYQELYLSMMDLNKYTMATMRARMGFSSQPRLVGRILSAYNDDKIYSVELVGAVLRQGSFVDKMYSLGWTAPGFFDGPSDELALQHALARYHAFLDLMSSSPASFFVPTLDIDLVWHTHQLLPEKYEADCTKHLKRFIDHDDKVESLRLSSAFDITCRAWKERFHVNYTHCGCPIPGNTIGQRLSRIVGIYSNAPPPSHLVPFERPDLLSGTHPSDHNSVHFVPKTERAHKIMAKRYENLEKKKQKERQKAAKKEAERGRLSDPRYVHAAAFLIPVPIFFGGAIYAGGGCVAGGHLVGSVGGCSSVSVVYFLVLNYPICDSAEVAVDVAREGAVGGSEEDVVEAQAPGDVGEEEVVVAAVAADAEAVVEVNPLMISELSVLLDGLVVVLAMS